MEFLSVFKSVVTDYIKRHNEYAGTVVDFFNHIDEAMKCVQSLPVPAQAELHRMLLSAFAANANYNR